MTTASDDKRPGRRRLAIGCLIIGALLVAPPLIFLAIYEGHGSNGPELQSVAFGTGGSGCDLDTVASSFPVGVPIRGVLTLEPGLRAGDVVTITVERNGTELVGRRETVRIETAADCISGTMRSLDAGHYRVTYAVSSSHVPPIEGEFDVTP